MERNTTSTSVHPKIRRYAICNAHNMHIGFTSPSPGIDEATPLERLIAMCFRTLRDWDEVSRLLHAEIKSDMKRQEQAMLLEWEELERQNKKQVKLPHRLPNSSYVARMGRAMERQNKKQVLPMMLLEWGATDDKNLWWGRGGTTHRERIRTKKKTF